jgi:hypothetical protein
MWKGNYQIMDIQTSKYHVSCTDGKISVRIKIGIIFNFSFHHRPIQVVVFFHVGLPLFLWHPWTVMDVVRMMKGMMVKLEDKGNSRFDSMDIQVIQVIWDNDNCDNEIFYIELCIMQSALDCIR